MHIDTARRSPGVASRSLDPPENARVVEAVRELLRRPDEKQSSLAPKLGVQQSTVSTRILVACA
jgi:hypothetical protein